MKIIPWARMTKISKFHACILTMYLAFSRVFKVNGELTTWPADTEAAVGQTIRLNCSTSEPYFINWEHIPMGAQQKEFVYFGGEMIEPYDQRFKVYHNQASGQYDLVMESVQLEDAGTYRCSDVEGIGESSEAELIVLRKPPTCSCERCTAGVSSCYTSKDIKPSTIQCEVFYSGNISPRLICSSEMSRISISDENKNGSVIMAKYALQYEEDTSVLNSEMLCYTLLSNISSNAFWTKTTSGNYKISSKTIDQPSQVNCELATDRVCKFKWIRADKNNETMSTERLWFVEEPGIYRCEADCSLPGVPCKVQPLEVVFEAKEETMKSNSKAQALVIPILASIAIIAEITVIVTFTIRRIRSKPNGRQNE